ncbi:leucine-rich PPR motif-containing protein, mitochondrial [Syngnathoides biaculeatus]|uniref:leucine-rich PPR motif-containing protein, mitochondrial n=1 Tax=Syngnathoides biaculeatus TaxID=300417 RepID=UPI002ADE39CB|nr:leucine-rich PPR motif-containing protein, mitochondrial [Syngnathoides biaculeatus]
MAALLRSTRFLKFSPLGLLQIVGTRRTGPPLSRLCSGSIGVGRTGVLTQSQRPSVDIASSYVWPCAAGCVRNYAVATEKKDEPSVAVRSKQAQHFDWALAKLDSSVRRTGRITKTLHLRIFHDICRTGYPSGNQALLLLRSCGSLLPEMSLDERTELAHRVWEKLQELGAQYDVSHYNALLKVYLQNEFKFSPNDFLGKMETANIQPNRVTYQRLIAAYCQNGDIEGASTILGFMKSKDLPITEAVFNALVTGHSRAGDIESAKNILSVMRGAGIDPGPDTFVSLLNAYAEKGDMDSLKKTLEEAENADSSLMDRDIMEVIFTLARAGHQQHIPEIVERLRHERGYIPDAMNLCLSLITQGHDDTAFLILKTFPSLQSDDINSDLANLGNFFLRHCVNMDTPLEKICHYCKELHNNNMHTSPLTFTLSCALEAKKTDLSLQLMKTMKEQNLPIRPHYFWPLLTQNTKDKNAAGVVEVIKGMQALDVTPDLDTISSYILPVFNSIEVARQTLKDAGISLESEGFVTSEIRFMATSNLAQLYTLLSDPSHPSIDLVNFRSSLIQGFRKSDDVENMVKITKLLYQDERYSKTGNNPADTVSYFLYNLIDSMSESTLHAQEDKLRNYFNQLKAQNIFLTENIYRGIRNLLQAKHVPELIKDVIVLVDPNDRVSVGPISTAPHPSGLDGKVPFLEAKLAELKAENQPLASVLKQIIQVLSAEENLQRALELKQQYEDEMSMGAYAVLINLCCRHNNVEEALNLKREMSRQDSSVGLDASKYIALVKVLIKNSRVEEATDILKEMKEKDVALNDSHVTMLFHALNAAVPKGGPVVQRLQETIFTLGLAKPSANLCAPLVSAYLDSNDLSGALDAALDCQKRYGHLPRIHDIVVILVEKGDTELLQKAMDMVSQERGEMTMLYDLFFAFLQTGRYREARKIIETPGLRARPGRLQWYAEKCISNQQMEVLEQMVDMTSKLFECDRDEMYCYLLRLCKETNDWQKAEAVWTKIQEENIIPRERTLRMLADVLKSNGQEVPFEVPETWYEQAANTQQVKPETAHRAAENGPQYQMRLLALCKKGKATEAFRMLKEADKKGVTLGPASYDHVIRALLAGGALKDATAVKDIAQSRLPGFQLSDTANSLLVVTQSKLGQTKDALETLKSMLQQDHVPSQLAITRLVQALSSQGDVAAITDVQSCLESLGTSLNLSTMLFTNNKALAHIKQGDLDSAVEILEEVYTSPDNKSPSMGFVFRKVLEENNDKAIDKLSAMAERLANHFACCRPATDLFLNLLKLGKVEEAKFMLARVNGLAEQKDALVSFVARASQRPGQVDKIKTLHNLIPDFVEKEVLYPYMMKCHVMDKDLASAKALYERMQEEGLVVDELSLKRLAVLYRTQGETAPFPEPSESFKFYAEKLKEKTAKVQDGEQST